MKKTIRVLLLGDVVGKIGRSMFKKHIQSIKADRNIDFTIVNGENSNNNGRGITSRIVNFFKLHGADVITSGNHIWDQYEIQEYLNSHEDLLRPANFPAACPGSGSTIIDCDGILIGVINVQGRVFMREHTDNPFHSVDAILSDMKTKTDIILIDFHAEATAEKLAMAFYVEGRVSAIVGTHTHIPTSDERILPGGTAYVTDLGMAGSFNSMIGMTKESVLPNFLMQMPSRFIVDTKPPVFMSGVCIEIDVESGKAIAIERVHIVDNELSIDDK